MRMHCKRGHLMTPENSRLNTSRENPYMRCVQCDRDRRRTRRIRAEAQHELSPFYLRKAHRVEERWRNGMALLDAIQAIEQERPEAASLTPPAYRPMNGQYEPAMTFDEIGQRLGISRAGACAIYHSALRKLARKKSAMREIEALVNLRAQSLGQSLWERIQTEA